MLLYDIYGKLLTAKQQEIFEEYYMYNLSLREIAKNKGISYQAIRDSIKSSEGMLENFEDKIKILDMIAINEKISYICDVKEYTSDEKVNKIKELLK